MPSTKNPFLVPIQVGNGPRPQGIGGGGAAEGLVAHITDPIDAHDASAISYAGGPAWADATTNPAGDVEAQLDKIISDLSPTTVSASGARKIGTESITLSTVTTPGGTLHAKLVDLHDAGFHAYSGGNAWADGTANPPTNVNAQLNKIIDDLTALSGASKIRHDATTTWADGLSPSGTPDLDSALNDGIVGDLRSSTSSDSGARKIGVESTTVGAVTNTAGTLYARLTALQSVDNINVGALNTWLGGRTNPQVALYDRLNAIIGDLGAQSAGDDGAERIGSQSRTGWWLVNLPVGSVASQIQAIISATTFEAPMVFEENVIFNNATGNIPDNTPFFDLNFSANVPTGDRRALHGFITEEGGLEYTIITYATTTPAGGFEIAVNCLWNGSAWVSGGQAGIPASKLALLSSGDLAIQRQDATLPASWSDAAWDVTNLIDMPGGNFTSTASAQGRGCIVAQAGALGVSDDALGVWSTYEHVFPATPSSISGIAAGGFNIGGTTQEISGTRDVHGVGIENNTTAGTSAFLQFAYTAS